MTELHAFILTYNESQHIRRCIESLEEHCTSITVVDSLSSDDTTTIAKQMGAAVLERAWVNYAVQSNFAIESLKDKAGWLLRIDADEVLSVPDGVDLKDYLANRPENVAGLLVNREIHFMSRRIKHGGIEPSWQLRLWRNGKGRCEQRWMDEHIEVDGDTERTKFSLADINLNSLSWWTDKHNSYASREAIDVLLRRAKTPVQTEDESLSGQAKVRRFMKESVYAKTPVGLRSILYTIYRYIFRLGFLDGRPGYFFHVLQGFWYRTLVDAKIIEIETHMTVTGAALEAAIQHCTGFDISQMPGETEGDS